MKLCKTKMPETMYRASRLCRIVGNPTAYLLLRCLQGGSLTVQELSILAEVSISTVSTTLRNLRLIEAVRYETVGMNKVYWIKDDMINEILDSLEIWVEAMRIFENEEHPTRSEFPSPERDCSGVKKVDHPQKR